MDQTITALIMSRLNKIDMSGDVVRDIRYMAVIMNGVIVAGAPQDGICEATRNYATLEGYEAA
jgi:hypothetical protein